jgi:hypothetical protein
MNRARVPSQSKQSLYDVFEKLQDYIKTNIDKRVALLFNNLGIKSLINGTDLQVSLTSGTSFNINSGVGMTNDYEVIKLTNNTVYDLTDAIVSNTEVTMNFANNTYYIIKLFWQLEGSIPVPVANGFNYNIETTLPEEQRYSKYSDSFVLSVQTITPGNMPTKLSNEVMLAIVKTDAAATEIDNTLASFDTGSEVITAVNGVVDIRHLNLLTQSDIKITDGNTLETSSITPANAGLLIQSEDDLPTEFKTAADEIIMKIDNLNRKIEITSTDEEAAALEVIGNIYSNGWKVLTEEIYSMKKMINFRVINICSINKMYGTSYTDPTLSDGDFAYDKGTRDRLRLNLEWGYNQITGVGNGSTFSVSGGGATWDNDELAGYHLWIPGPGSGGTNYYIASNVSNILTLHSSYQTLADLGTNLQVTSSAYAKINHNVTRYEIAAVPYNDGLLDDRDVESESVTYGSSPVVQKRGLALKAGVKYNVTVRGIRGDGVIGDWTPLLWDLDNVNGAAGTFTYMGVTYNYGPNGDVLMKHVTLSDPGATLTAIATASGFKAVLTPGTDPYNWSEAEEYEFAWSDAGTTINWANPATYESKITALPNVSIATYDSIEYNISVRPLIGRMSVGTPLNTTIISGTGGALPANNIIATTKVELYSFKGSTVTYSDATIEKFTFSGSIYSPSESTNTTTYMNLKSGDIVTIEVAGTDRDYQLTTRDSSDGTEWKIIPVGHAVYPSNGSSYAYEINTSKRARRVYSSVLQADTQITKLEAVCDTHEGENITVRVYQITKESSADYCIVSGDVEGPTGSNQTFSSAGDHLVLSANGARTLIIDLWDPTAPPDDDNDGSFVGTINVYGQTYTATAYDKYTVAQ